MDDESKVLIIGLDGATLELIRPWAQEGKLPTFARLLREGTSTPLRSTMQPASPPAWVTFRTGVNPGKHGVFDFCLLRIDRPFTLCPFRSVPSPSFWEILSKHRSAELCLVNVPFTFPAQPIRGRMIAGFPIVGTGQPIAYPTDLMAEIEQNVGSYVVDVRTNVGESRYTSHEQFINDVMRIVRSRSRTATYLLSHYPWDLGVIVFTMPDRVQNVYWQYADPSDLRPTKADRERFGDVILRVYQTIDEFLAQSLDLLGHEGMLLIMSDHGFGSMFKDVNLNRWLADEGFLAPERKAFDGVSHLRRGVKALAKRLLPPRAVEAIRRHRSAAQSNKPAPTLADQMPVDWTQTRAYALGKFGNIMINLQGREPYGILAAGEEYESVRSALIDKLLLWRNPITGRQMVKRVYRREDLYAGPFLDQAPDLVIEWEDYRYVGFHPGSPHDPLLIDPARGSYRRLGWTGNHRPDGILIAYGPEIRQGQVIEGAHIQDLACTVLYYMTDVVPAHMDGRVLYEMFTPQFVAEHPVRVEPIVHTTEVDPETALTDEERQNLEERLRALGYL